MHVCVKRRLAEADSSNMTASMMWHCLNEIMQKAIASFVPCRPVVTSKAVFTWAHMYGVHVRRTCAMNIYTIIHVRRTPYMCARVNTA